MRYPLLAISVAAVIYLALLATYHDAIVEVMVAAVMAL
jgi:hypothetical protein